jgi:hypothetical protein
MLVFVFVVVVEQGTDTVVEHGVETIEEEIAQSPVTQDQPE